jgi:MFS family permease
LYVLFFTELWERYSFYSMMAILSLYMNESLHFSVAKVGQVYGAYQAGVYLMPVAGGLIADKLLGFSRAIVIGGVLMMFGHLVLGVEALPFFYGGLVLLACGSGLLKPNVSTLVGNLYRQRPELRDQGFNIYYMGVNIGAFVSPLTVAWLRDYGGRRRSCRPQCDAVLAVRSSVQEPSAELRRRWTKGRAADAGVGEVTSRVITLLRLVFRSCSGSRYQIFYVHVLARDSGDVVSRDIQACRALGSIAHRAVCCGVAAAARQVDAGESARRRWGGGRVRRARLRRND